MTRTGDVREIRSGFHEGKMEEYWKDENTIVLNSRCIENELNLSNRVLNV